MKTHKFNVGDTIRRHDGNSTYHIINITPYGYRCEGVANYLRFYHEDKYEKVNENGK